MAPRRRAAAQEEEEEMEQETGLTALKFNESLSWRVGNAIPAEQLLKRLDRLWKELGDMEQEQVDIDSLATVAKELAQSKLLNHKDKGVRAMTACCLVEMLRLHAPNAPYTPNQLKDIFNLIINGIIPALFDPSNPYNGPHKYVVQSLSEVKSIVILNELDVDGIETLLVSLFSHIFDGVSSPRPSNEEQLDKEVEFMMQEMLSSIIEEASGLPQKVVDVIMAQFLRAAASGGKDRHDAGPVDENQATLDLKEEPEAYQIAKHLCKSFPEKMSRFVGQYFADVIMDAGPFSGGKSNGNRDRDDEDDEDDEEEGDTVRGPSDSDLKELRKAHVLVREVWKAAPEVLQNVVPQIESELATENVPWRQLAVETLGDMISGIGAAGPPPPPTLDPTAYPLWRMDEDEQNGTFGYGSNVLTTPLSSSPFPTTHPSTFVQFMNRKHDKAPAIRAAWTTSVGYILATSAGGIGLSRDDENALIQGLGEKLSDGDEKVRLAAVKAIECFRFRDVVVKLGAGGGVGKEGSLLATLADRCRDRKPAVRVEAMSLMAKLWAVGTGELLAGHEAVTSALSGIPSRIFNSIYANDAELNLLIDRVTYEYLVPLSFPPTKKGTKTANGGSQSQIAATSAFDPDAVRAERVLLLVRSLDPEAKKACYAVHVRRQPQFANVIKTFIAQCEAYNGGVMDKDREQRTANLDKSARYIAQFLPDREKAKTELMRFAKLNERRYYHLVKFMISQESDFSTAHKALKELIKRIQGSKDAYMLDTLLPTLYRSGCFMFNRSHLSTIMEYSKAENHDMASVALEILNELSQHNPDLFKTHIGQLCKDLVDQAPSSTRENDPAVVETLKACSSYCRKYPKEIPMDKPFVQTMMSFALYGRPYKAAKYAVNILLSKKDEKSMVSATDLIQRTMRDWTYGSANFLNKLTIVAQLELHAPKVTEEYEDTVLNMTVQQILLQVKTEASDHDPNWVSDADMDEECQAKCLALKILVNRMRASSIGAEKNEQLMSVWKLLRTLIRDKGELCKTADTPAHHQSRLRLLAGQLVLKLCTSKQFDDLLTPQSFNTLAFTTQDAVEEVRHLFMDKLQKYLTQKKMRARFYTIPFLMAFEPRQEYKARIETWIRSRARYFEETKQQVFEAIMARLISLLSHHPDFGNDMENLMDHAKYIVFYVSLVATEANLGMIYKYAERVKQTQDAIDPKSENHRVLCDLAQAVIRKWQERKGWIFNAYGGKVGIPVGLYIGLQSHDEAQEVAEKQYIPDGAEEKLDEILRAFEKKKKRKSMDDRHELHPPAKKARAAPKGTQPREPKVPSSTIKKRGAAAPKQNKTPAKPKATKVSTSSEPAAASRRSERSRGNRSYIERDDSEDDDEMLEGVAEWEYENEDEDDSGEPQDSDAESVDQDAAADGDANNKKGKATKAATISKGGTNGKGVDEDSELSDLESLPSDDDKEDEGDEAEDTSAPAKSTTGKKGKMATAGPKGRAAAAKTAAKGKAVAKPPTRASRSRKKTVEDSDEMGEDDD